MTKIVEFFGTYTGATGVDWSAKVRSQECPFDGQRCFKVRKSSPEISIGTCTVQYGRPAGPVMICPKRLIDKGKIFTDCMHLLTKHQPGNEYHLLPEVPIPGGSVDFVLASVKRGRVVDFVGVELQTLDTTGTVWPERQRFLMQRGVIDRGATENKTYGMNWKHTAKTILVQMHHKAETFSHVNRHLVLVIQEQLLAYMRKEFSFDHFSDPADVTDTVHLHGYALDTAAAPGVERLALDLADRISTDVAGVQRSLGLKTEATVEEANLLATLSERVSARTLFNPLAQTVPAAVREVFDTPEGDLD